MILDLVGGGRARVAERAAAPRRSPESYSTLARARRGVSWGLSLRGSRAPVRMAAAASPLPGGSGPVPVRAAGPPYWGKSSSANSKCSAASARRSSLKQGVASASGARSGGGECNPASRVAMSGGAPSCIIAAGGPDSPPTEATQREAPCRSRRIPCRSLRGAPRVLARTLPRSMRRPGYPAASPRSRKPVAALDHLEDQRGLVVAL